jgi:hypothetical protein
MYYYYYNIMIITNLIVLLVLQLQYFCFAFLIFCVCNYHSLSSLFIWFHAFCVPVIYPRLYVESVHYVDMYICTVLCL